MIRLSLRAKFSMVLLALILVMMGSIWWMSILQQSEMESGIVGQQQASMRLELNKRARDIFTILNANSEAIAIGDFLTVDAVVRELKKSPDILFIHIVQHDKLMIPLPEKPVDEEYVPPAWIMPAGESFKLDTVKTPDNAPALLASGPLTDRSINVKVAEAYVAISHRPIQEAVMAAQDKIKYHVRSARYNLTFATMLFSICGVVAAFVLIAYVIRPLNKLAQGAQIIGEGNLNHIVPIESNDEVGDLAATFNVMTKNLREDRVQLVEKEKLEQELKIATQIQHNLLPRRLPEADGYSFGAAYAAAREVSGDYYDFLTVPSGNGHPKIGVVVADVSGKGIPGAFMMTVTRSVLRAKASDSSDPSEILKSTNAILLPDMKKGMFVSMFYGILDVSSGVIEFANAGHNPSLVYRAQTGEVSSLRCRGLAMGIGDAPAFDRLAETRRLSLNEGDVFFQYTDGIQHAMNASDERFGMPRLIDLIRQYGLLDAHDMVRRILNEVSGFAGGNSPFDDITMVAIKRNSTKSGV